MPAIKSLIVGVHNKRAGVIMQHDSQQRQTMCKDNELSCMQHDRQQCKTMCKDNELSWRDKDVIPKL
jgi:hypothetical protein